MRLLSDQSNAAILAQTEQLHGETLAARDEVFAALSGVVAPKATVEEIAADDPDVDPEYYKADFYDTNYRTGSGGVYRKQGSEPTHAAKVQNGNSTWYSLAEANPRVEQFGGGTGNAGADGAALEAMVGYVASTGLVGGTVTAPAGTYAMTKGTLLPKGNTWEFNGALLDYSSVSNSAMIPVFGSMPNTCMAGLGTQSAAPDLASNVSKWAFALPITGHGFVEDDIGLIYNPTDFSFNTSRSYYRAGEMFRCMQVTSADAFRVDGPLWASYAAADVEIFKYNPWTGTVRNVRIKGNGSTVTAMYGFLCDIARDVELKNVRSTNVSFNAVGLSRTFVFTVDRCGGYEDGILGFGGGYGFGEYSCQRGRVTRVHGLAWFHGITNSNTDGAGPPRDIVYEQCSAASTAASNSAWSFDCHGPTEKITIRDSVFPQGIVSGCRDFTVENCELGNFPNYSYSFYLTEANGGYLRLHNNTYRITGAIANARGIIECGAETGARTDSLSSDLHIDVDGITIYTDGVANDQHIMRVGTRNATFKVNFDIRHIADNHPSRFRVALVTGLAETPIAAEYYRVHGIKRLAAGASLATYTSGASASVACHYEPQRGVRTFASGTGTSQTDTVIFPWSYPEQPNFVGANIAEPVTTNSGAKYPVAQATNRLAASLVIRVRNHDFAAFSPSVELTATWHAGLTR